MNIFVIGAQGRMGEEIQKVLRKTKGAVFSGGIARKAKGSVVTGFDGIKHKPDLVIDFSSPEMFLQTLQWCVEKKIPLLSGTTGLSKKHFSALKKASKKMVQ